MSSSAERRLLWLLALTQFTVILDFMIMMPLGPQIMRAFSIQPAAFAAVVSVYSWFSGLSGLFAATYVDRFNRRSLLLVVYGVFALSNLACACSGDFKLLLLARVLAGLSGGVIGSVIMAVVADVIPVQRRGAAMGTIMSAFGLASILGVPAGIFVGAHFEWSSPFYVLFALSVLIASAGAVILPSLTEHLHAVQPVGREVLPRLWRLIASPNHRYAFALTFTLMAANMMVIPFLSPMLVANHGVEPKNLGWLYMAGGSASLVVMRLIGRTSDRFGHRTVFRVMLAASILPILLFTHLPAMTFWMLLACFSVFMVSMAGRVVPLQALLTTIPTQANRGAFLSVNSSFQSLGSGCGAWLGGLLLVQGANGELDGYGSNGWLAVVLALIVMACVGKLHSDKAVVNREVPVST